VAADPDEAARWLRVSGESGDHASRVDLANLVLDGAGSTEDPARVAHWFEQAAAVGDLVAAFNLGLCLDKGIGVEPNAQQATHWLRRAAEGVPEAQYMYGRMLAGGHGVPADPEGARLDRPRFRSGPARGAGGARRTQNFRSGSSWEELSQGISGPGCPTTTDL
jgi:uncharacterized protein